MKHSRNKGTACRHERTGNSQARADLLRRSLLHGRGDDRRGVDGVRDLWLGRGGLGRLHGRGGVGGRGGGCGGRGGGRLRRGGNGDDLWHGRLLRLRDGERGGFLGRVLRGRGRGNVGHGGVLLGGRGKLVAEALVDVAQRIAGLVFLRAGRLARAIDARNAEREGGTTYHFKEICEDGGEQVEDAALFQVAAEVLLLAELRSLGTRGGGGGSVRRRHWQAEGARSGHGRRSDVPCRGGRVRRVNRRGVRREACGSGRRGRARATIERGATRGGGSGGGRGGGGGGDAADAAGDGGGVPC